MTTEEKLYELKSLHDRQVITTNNYLLAKASLELTPEQLEQFKLRWEELSEHCE